MYYFVNTSYIKDEKKIMTNRFDTEGEANDYVEVCRSLYSEQLCHM